MQNNNKSITNKKPSNILLILSVLVIASCGLAYELIAGALASYVLGDSVLQFSTIIGSYLFAMGIGSYLSKFVPDDKLQQRFIEIEILVGLIGGLSATGLFVAFAWLPRFQALLYAVVLSIGILVGMEIPLIMRILHKQKQSFTSLVSHVLTFDYLGALIVSLLFPLVLAPKLGLARSAIAFGLLNIIIAGLTACYFVINPLKKRLLRQVFISLCALIMGFIYANHLVSLSEQQRFKSPVIFAASSPYQRLVVTERNHHIQLFLNGNLQFSTRDEYRYHEALVHPALQSMQTQLSAAHPSLSVLILGGGDGMATREVLKYPNVDNITLVDLDKTMTDIFATKSRFTQLNQQSLTNPKVHIINEDAYHWLATQAEDLYDVIIIDLPDPSQYSLAKLYSVSMYKMVNQQLASNGIVVVQSTSPYYAPKSFWSIDKTLQAASFRTTPYHLYVPSFGEWGFIIAQHKQDKDFVIPTAFDIDLQFLTPEVTESMFYFTDDLKAPKNTSIEANTLDKQPLVRYYLQDWKDE